MKVAVIGAGWAGMAAAVATLRAGHLVTVYEAARTLGGRARAVPTELPDGTTVTLDNGQHIMIGAYAETLALLQFVGIDLDSALLALPLTLRRPDGSGLKLPRLRAPFDAAIGIASARGWNGRDKLALARASLRWQRSGFQCGDTMSVADLCTSLTERVRTELVEPLCVSALNTPIQRASGQVFLRVLRDSLFGAGFGRFAASNLLLPRIDLSALFPAAAARWIDAQGGKVFTGQRVDALVPAAGGWRIDGAPFDAVLLATAPWDAARLVERAQLPNTQSWLAATQALRYEGIATVYAFASPILRLAEPMLSLRSDQNAPAQFAFDRGRIGGPVGLLAFVVSACGGDRELLEAAVCHQARDQLGIEDLRILRTIVEKRATFACTPGLIRPVQQIAPGLLACGDYAAGPYPATIEGAVRSGLNAVRLLDPT